MLKSFQGNSEVEGSREGLIMDIESKLVKAEKNRALL